MKRSNNGPSTTPLPRPRASRRSTLERLSRCFNDSVPDLSRGGTFHGQRRAVDHENEKNSTENRSSDNASDKRKKSVRFQRRNATLLCGLNDTLDISFLEKGIRWYGAADFDRFKRNAAADARVTVARSEKGHHVVAEGDFDGRLDGLGGEDGAADASSNGTVSKKARYNENEYDDFLTGCRRGLGHHFSRTRKRSRAAARAAVVAWQRSLLTDAAAEASPDRAERVRLTLALVSSRCSRTARQEARWRGDVDYRVAHPERHAGAPGAPSATPPARDEGEVGGPADRAAGKRDRASIAAPAAAASSCDGDAPRKRRRRTGGGSRRVPPAPAAFAGVGASDSRRSLVVRDPTLTSIDNSVQ